jgi:hypothetical protein
MKLLTLLSAVAVVVALAFAWSPFGQVRADAAVVVKDGGCTVFDGDGNLVFLPESSHSVVTGGNSGNAKVTCKGEVDPSSTEKGAVHFDFDSTGVLCNTPLGATDKWHQVVTPSGQTTLTCLVR